MNKLSWFLYFADVLESFKTVFIMITIISFFITAVWTIIFLFSNYDSYGSGKVKFPKWFMFPVLFIFLTLSVIIPSEKTMYMIAGSEASQAVATSDTGKRLINDIEKKIFETLEKKDDK